MEAKMIIRPHFDVSYEELAEICKKPFGNGIKECPMNNMPDKFTRCPFANKRCCDITSKHWKRFCEYGLSYEKNGYSVKVKLLDKE